MLGCSLAVWGVGFRAWGFGVYGLELRLGSRVSVGFTWRRMWFRNGLQLRSPYL